MSPVQKGIDEETFDRLWPKLVARFRRLGASEEDAQDLSQKTLMEAHRGCDSFQGHADFDTWVISIAKNKWLQHLRNQGRLKRQATEMPIETLQQAAPSDTRPDPEAETLSHDLMARIQEAIKSLPEQMQQALLLFVKGRKYRDIAVVLGVNENRVSSLIHQARSKLRRQFPT